MNNASLLEFMNFYSDNKESEDLETMLKIVRIENWLVNNPAKSLYTEFHDLETKLKVASLSSLLQRDILIEMPECDEKNRMMQDYRKNILELMEIEMKKENILYIFKTKVFYDEDFENIILDTRFIFENLKCLASYRENVINTNHVEI